MKMVIIEYQGSRVVLKPSEAVVEIGVLIQEGEESDYFSCKIIEMTPEEHEKLDEFTGW